MINRRDATKLLCLAAIGAACKPRLSFATDTAPEVSITMDDFRLLNVDEQTAGKRNEAILSTLRSRSLKAAIFVAGMNVDSQMGQRLLKRWSDEGHIIANHTYSHRNYVRSDFAQYTADILRCEELIKGLPQFRRLFRFPMLKEGDTAQQRDRMRAFLDDHGYRNGAVTIDASDWYIDQRLTERLKANSSADTTGYRDYYLQHIRDRSAYYDDLSVRTLGRSVRHTLLVHYNLLNELYLGDLLDQYRNKGWKLIDAAEAFTDPVFSEQPNVLPAGESLVFALALQTGKINRPRYPAEDGDYEAPSMDRLGL